MPNVVNFETVIRAMLPKGDLYIPQEFLQELISGPVNLIQNGDFDSNIDYWTGGSGVTWVATGGGRMRIQTNTTV